MADNFAQFYSGNMAPPLKLPGGGYAPAPSLQPQMSPEEIYQGIYGEPLQLTSRSVKTVPAPMQAVTDAQFGVGAGVKASGDAYYRSPRVELPNPYPGPDPVAKTQDRLPALPVGLPLKTDTPGYASARGYLGPMGAGSGYLTFPPRIPKGDGTINLSALDLTDIAGQRMADSEGKPIKDRTGKVWYPGGKAPSGRVSGSMSAPDNRGPLSQLLGLKTSGLGGLLGGLFGGMQQSSGGGLGGLLGGGASHGITGVGGGGAFVAPQGSSLESTYGSGAVLPAAMNNERWTTGY